MNNLFPILSLEDIWEREIVLVKYGNNTLTDIFHMTDQEIDYKIPKIIQIIKAEIKARSFQ